MTKWFYSEPLKLRTALHDRVGPNWLLRYPPPLLLFCLVHWIVWIYCYLCISNFLFSFCLLFSSYMCEPPDSHIPHTRPCPETFSGLPRLERLQLCEEVGLGSPSNTKWEPSPPSPHQDRFCLPENFSKLSCIGQDWSFGISLSIIWTFLSFRFW